MAGNLPQNSRIFSGALFPFTNDEEHLCFHLDEIWIVKAIHMFWLCFECFGNRIGLATSQPTTHHGVIFSKRTSTNLSQMSQPANQSVDQPANNPWGYFLQRNLDKSCRFGISARLFINAHLDVAWYIPRRGTPARAPPRGARHPGDLATDAAATGCQARRSAVTPPTARDDPVRSRCAPHCPRGSQKRWCNI